MKSNLSLNKKDSAAAAKPAANVPEGIRTPDPRLRRPLLYPAELRTHPHIHIPGRNKSSALRLRGRLHNSYAKAGDGNRTHVSSLEGWCSTIELHPHNVGVTGFEPAASWSQTRRSSQAEPHPAVHCTDRQSRIQIHLQDICHSACHIIV